MNAQTDWKLFLHILGWAYNCPKCDMQADRQWKSGKHVSKLFLTILEGKHLVHDVFKF